MRFSAKPCYQAFFIHFDLIWHNILYIIQIILMIDSGRVQNNSKSIIRYYQPYSRLRFRSQIQKILQRNPKISSMFRGIDVAAIIDAVAKRGGSQLPQQRIREILTSLPYYDPNIVKYGLHVLQSKFEQYFGQVAAEIGVIPEPFIEEHLLPVSNEMLYYEMNSNQLYFMQQNFGCADEYFCIKTLAYFGAIQDKLDTKYLGKYHKMRRWLYINDYITKPPQADQKILPSLPPKKICIIGLTIPNIIMGIKLSKLGLLVKLVDISSANLERWMHGCVPDIVKEGVFVCNQVERGRIGALLEQHVGLSLSRVNCTETMAEDSILTKYQHLFIILVQEIMREYPNNSEKLMWDELNLKAIIHNSNFNNRHKDRYRIEEKVDIISLKACYDRLICLNKVKNAKSATVGDVHRLITCSYSPTQTKSKLAMVLTCSTYHLSPQKTLNPTPNPLPKLTSLLSPSPTSPHTNLTFQTTSILDSLQQSQNKWKITLKNPTDTSLSIQQQFDYVVYGACRLGKQKEDVLGVLGVLGGLGGLGLDGFSLWSSVLCLYRFKERVLFRGVQVKKEGSSSNHYLYYNAQFGIVHFYLVGNCDEVVAMVNPTSSSNTDYYKDIGLILMNHILKKPTKLQTLHPTNQHYLSQTYLHIQQQQHIQTLSKTKQKQHLYLNPILATPLHNGNTLSSSLYVNNIIIGRLVGRLGMEKDGKEKEGEEKDEKEEVVGREEMEEEGLEEMEDVEGGEGRDLFGLECKLVVQWKQCMKNAMVSIQKYNQDGYGSLCMIPKIQAHSPIVIEGQTSPIYLLSLGLPYHINNNLHLIHFVSIRISNSLVHNGRVGIFYQTCLIYNSELIYCIVQLDQKYQIQLILFHNDLPTLINTITHTNPTSQNPNPPTHTPPKPHYISPTLLINHIQTTTQNTQPSTSTYTQILKNTIQNTQPHQNGNIFNGILKIGVDFVEDVYMDACGLVRYYCGVYGIRACCLVDVVIGKVGLVGIWGELRDDGGIQAQGCLDVLKYLIAQQNTKYELKIDASGILRRFINATKIDGKYYQEYSFYTYKQMQTIPDKKDSEQHLKNWIKQIIRNLLQKQLSSHQIINQFQALIRQQVQGIVQILNMRYSQLEGQANLYNYIVMTRMEAKRSVQDNEQKSENYFRVKEWICSHSEVTALTNQQQQQLKTMIDEDDLITYGNEFILSYFQQ